MNNKNLSNRALYILLLGPPGSGKGTQAALLKDALGIPHISSGELFREHLKKQTKLGKEANEYIDRGELVPDNVTIAMVMERLNLPDTRNGALLDGFPRTVPQAQALDQALEDIGSKLEVVISISVPEEELVERISGRLLCKVGGESYHVRYKPPIRSGVCDIDGGELYRREDDKPETVHKRIKVYWEQTNPLIGYYREKGILREINGDQSIEAVEDEILSILGERIPSPK
jgi:adenylate kinase